MKITKYLKKEHITIRMIADIMGRLSEKSIEKARPRKHLRKIITLSEILIENNHWCKEETILFPAMTENGIRGENNIIQAMLDDHEQTRMLLSLLRNAFSRDIDVRQTTVPKLHKILREFQEHLRFHLEKEEELLYPLADQLIPPDRQGELFSAYQQIEKKQKQAGDYEKKQEIITFFKKIYGQALINQNGL